MCFRLFVGRGQAKLWRRLQQGLRRLLKIPTQNSKERKRRLWKEKQELRKREPERRERAGVFTEWMYLPDLVLEHIFKFLSYKVSCTSLVS